MAEPWYRWPPGLRETIFARDDGHCQIQLPEVCQHIDGDYQCATVIDHIIPVLSGGRWFDPSNLRAACRPCNNRRRQRSGPTPTTPTPVRHHPERW